MIASEEVGLEAAILQRVTVQEIVSLWLKANTREQTVGIRMWVAVPLVFGVIAHSRVLFIIGVDI